MGSILGLGMSHYPGFLFGDDKMADLDNRITSGKIPPELTEPSSWPAPMQQEWGDDRGLTFAARHRAEFMAAAGKVRAAIDEFGPDAVVIFGEDRYETFHEDIVPPYCLFIQNEFLARPFAGGRAGRPVPKSYWGDDPGYELRVPGNSPIAAQLNTALLEAGFDVASSYTPGHGGTLCHSFANTLLYLDNERRGWPHRVIPFHVNAYGTQWIRAAVQDRSLLPGRAGELDPPPPTAARTFALGAQLARVILESDWRIALIGSASWSHAVGVPKHSGLYPDLETDGKRFEELRTGNYASWASLQTDELESAGQSEILNWLPLIGAMSEAEAGAPVYASFHATYLMSSLKATAIFKPVEA